MNRSFRGQPSLSPQPWTKAASLLGYTKLYGQVAGGQAEYLRVPQAQYGPIKVPEGPPDDRFSSCPTCSRLRGRRLNTRRSRPAAPLLFSDWDRSVRWTHGWLGTGVQNGRSGSILFRSGWRWRLATEAYAAFQGKTDGTIKVVFVP